MQVTRAVLEEPARPGFLVLLDDLDELETKDKVADAVCRAIQELQDPPAC